jgi:hypothetical protein
MDEDHDMSEERLRERSIDSWMMSVRVRLTEGDGEIAEIPATSDLKGAKRRVQGQ